MEDSEQPVILLRKLQDCLKALDEMGATISAAQLSAAIASFTEQFIMDDARSDSGS